MLSDLPAVLELYAFHVRNGSGSFEETPPDPDTLAARFADIVGQHLPYLVAESQTGLDGFAYAGRFRTRDAYRYTVEDSIYVASGRAGRGVGRALLSKLIARCTDLGYRQMVAGIGDSTNAGSIRLHESLGFRLAGTLRSVGYKHGRWVDLVLMQRQLDTGYDPPAG